MTCRNNQPEVPGNNPGKVEDSIRIVTDTLNTCGKAHIQGGYNASRRHWLKPFPPGNPQDRSKPPLPGASLVNLWYTVPDMGPTLSVSQKQLPENYKR